MNLFLSPRIYYPPSALFTSYESRQQTNWRIKTAWSLKWARQGVQSQRCTRIRREERAGEREKEGSGDNEERQKRQKKREPEQRTSMMGKQTRKQAEWKTQPAFLLGLRFASACVEFFRLAGDKPQHRGSVWAGIRRPERWRGGQSAGRTRPGRSLAPLKYQTLTLSLVCLFVRFSISILCSSSQQRPFLFSPQPKAEISRPSCSLALSHCGQQCLLLCCLQTLRGAFSYFALHGTRTDCVS